CWAHPAPAPAYSCASLQPCAPPGPNDVAFVGVVLSQGARATSDESPVRPTVFQVEEAFFGLEDGSSQAEVWSDEFESFKPGTRWVIDAFQGDSDPIPITRGCGRTARLGPSGSSGFADALRARRDGTAPTSIHIFVDSSDLSGLDEIGDVEVTLTSPAAHYRWSGEQLEEAQEIQPGEYTVEVVGGPLPPAGLKPPRFAPLVGSCQVLIMELGHRTEISGVLSQPDGSPAASTLISIGTDAADAAAQNNRAHTDAEGRFALRGMLPGEYFLFASKEGYRDSYFPGTGLASAAQPVGVVEGTLRKVDFALGGKISKAKVTLMVTGANGEPAVLQPISIDFVESFEGVDERSILAGGLTD
ncbi:MAG: carboxypeptidase regulatory-like domain-containing protein, partial [Myxococcales bacterium]|nr:carboxypeptidase regulatory-like domain-containing protein [Myxococcales bacterium]